MRRLRRLLDRVPTWVLFVLNVLLILMMVALMLKEGIVPYEVV